MCIRDRCVIGSYQMFYDQALEAVQGMRELWPGADELPSEGTAQNNTCLLYTSRCITQVERRAKKVVAYLAPEEFSTNWGGNKAI